MNRSSMRIRIAAGLCSAALLLGGCGAPSATATLVNVNKGEDKIPYGYGYFVARFNQAEYDSYYVQFYGNTHYWKQTTGEDEDVVNAQTVEQTVKSNIMDDLEDNYISTKHASEYGVELTDEDTKKIEEAADKFLEDNSDEVIEKMGATRDYLIRYMTESAYNKKLEEAMKKEGENTIKEEDVAQTSYTYIHVYNDKYAENAVERSDEELKAIAEAVASADDFKAAAKEQGLEVSSDTFASSMSAKDAAEEYRSPEEVIKAVKALEHEGDVSPVIPVEDDGYYVVRLKKLYDEKETHAELDDKIDLYYTDTFTEWTKDTDWDIDEKLWEKVSFDDVLFADPEELAEEAEEEEAEETTEEASDEAAEETTDDASDDSTEEAEEEPAEDNAEE